MTAIGSPPLDMQRRLEEAAGWRLRLAADPGAAQSGEYLAWLADEANERAARAVDRGWDAVGAVSDLPEMLEMRRQALSRLRRAELPAGSRHRWLRYSAAALLVGLFGGGLYAILLQPLTYSTDIGERHAVTLADGSQISMDSDTKLLVDYSKNARALTLVRGRARFDVAHDANRPFTVSAGAETVVAVGTSFDVEKLGSTVLVTLIQGQVVVKNEAGSSTRALSAKPKPSVSLAAGQQMVAASGAAPAVAPADLQVASAWEGGHLVFRDEPLETVVTRVNRYTNNPLSLDPVLAGIRISGVFNAGDIGSFVSALTSYEPIQATTTATGAILLQPRR